MAASDEILNAVRVAITTPVAIKDEFRVSMKLLLHYPDEHSRFDDELLLLWEMFRGSDPYEICVKKARELIESVTDKQPGNYCLVRQTWETDRYKGDRCVMKAWFDGRVCGYEVADSLHAAITEMVRFVLDATTPFAQQKCKAELIEALSLYLDKRGKDVMKHPDGPEGGRWFWWEGKRHEIPQGQVYGIVNFMWDRDSALFDDLIHDVFRSPVADGSVKTAVNRVNNALRLIPRFPWMLTTDGVGGIVSWKAK